MSKRPVRFSLILLGALSLINLSGCDLLADLPAGKGFSAKYLCSYIFNSEFEDELVINRFVRPKVEPLPLVWQIDIDHENKTVTVGDGIFLNEYLKGRAVYREGLGCTLLVEKPPEEVLSQTLTPMPPPVLPEDKPWPQGRAGIDSSHLPNLDRDALDKAIELAFTEPKEAPLNTTSLLVAHQGKLIAERYALGATPSTPLLGWSMTKTLSGTLIGILNDKGLLDIDDPAPIPGWQGTAKEAITTRDIIHMASGLDFNEDYEGKSDVTALLYEQSDQVAYASGRPLVHQPGTYFNYTTGDANLLSKIVHDASGGTMQSAYDFYQSELFHKVGISSAFIEVDTTGQFVGGAYGFMTARDWLRMGQLYLQQGEWNGEQVVSSQWIDYVTRPSPAADYYGGQLWLNTGGNEWPELPFDAYYFAGHQGQRVIVIPSKDLVVARTGVTEDYNYLNLGPAVSEIITVIERGY